MEVTNKTLMSIIKKRLENSKGIWPEELLNILWAYRTTVRTSTSETPFLLAFGIEAVIPVKIGMATYRTMNFNLGRNKEILRHNLDMLKEKRDEATLWAAAYKHKMTKYYNSQVRTRRFAVGDLVLRMVSLATQDPTDRKVRPNCEGPYQVTSYHRLVIYHLKMMLGEPLPRP